MEQFVYSQHLLTEAAEAASTLPWRRNPDFVGILSGDVKALAERSAR